MWQHLIDLSAFLKQLDALLVFLSTLLWGVYVFYTIRTFLEIKRQTELQSQAFLVLNSDIRTEARDDLSRVSPLIQALYDKWHDILARNLPKATQPPSYFVLTLRNRGKSDIVDWKITIHLDVAPLQFLSGTYNISGEHLSWTIHSNGSEDYIPPDKHIDVVLAPVGVFPRAEFTWEIGYADYRGTRYARFGGDARRVIQNALANPSQENTSSG